MSVMAQIEAAFKQEMAQRMQAAADNAAQELEQEMRNSINSIVYGLGTSGDFARTYAFANSWQATGTAQGTNVHVELTYNGSGSHPSVDGTKDITGALDDVIMHGSGPAVQSAANAGRDYYTPVEAKAPEIVRRAIVSTL